MWTNKRVVCLSKKASSSLPYLISFQLKTKLNSRKKNFVYQFCNISLEGKIVKTLTNTFKIYLSQKKKVINKHGSLLQG